MCIHTPMYVYDSSTMMCWKHDQIPGREPKSWVTFQKVPFSLASVKFHIKEVFNICLLKQPLEASTAPAICKLYNAQHGQILKYGQVNTLYLASDTRLKLDLPCAVSRSTTASGIKLAELGTVAWSSVTLPSDGDADRI